MKHPKLEIAVKAARLAGNCIQHAALDLNRITITQKKPNDFVTSVDQEAERLIIDCLKKVAPTDAFLGEESGLTNSETQNGYQWIIDPLDGTSNFIHSIPHYCVSIALYNKGKPELGVVYDPDRNELFETVAGQGAYLNGKRLRIDSTLELKDAIVATSFSIYHQLKQNNQHAKHQSLNWFEKVIDSCTSVRHIGAAALDLAYVAAGRYDALFVQGLQPWDCAAGALLVREAGGFVGNFRGNECSIHDREMLAGKVKVFAQLVGILGPCSIIA